MLNQTVLVGRLVEDPKINTTKNGCEESIITLAVPRNYRNSNGEYDTDFINCILYRGIATNTCEYCEKGSLIGVEGRIEVIKNKMIVVAEKVTYLSTRKEEED